MQIRIGTFNVENLFSRARVINEEDPQANDAMMNDVATLNTLICKASYSDVDKAAMKEILDRYHVTKPSKRSFVINEIRGRLYKDPAGDTGVAIVASGRSSWVGWIELEREVIPTEAIQNTARVIAAMNADILCLVEVENRTALDTFSTEILNGMGFLHGDRRYGHNMVIDGNDERGIDVGILSRWPIRNMRSHIDDGGDTRIFSRDCPEFEVCLPNGRSVWMLANHLKSRRGGSQRANSDKRRRQADRIAEVLKTYSLTEEFVVVAGDLNDTPESTALAPVLQHPDLHNVLARLPTGSDTWTYRSPREQIDYLLVSTAFNERCVGAQIERRGLYSRNNFGGKYEHFPEVTSLRNQASDHAAVWAMFDVS